MLSARKSSLSKTPVHAATSTGEYAATLHIAPRHVQEHSVVTFTDSLAFRVPSGQPVVPFSVTLAVVYSRLELSSFDESVRTSVGEHLKHRRNSRSKLLVLL